MKISGLLGYMIASAITSTAILSAQISPSAGSEIRLHLVSSTPGKHRPDPAIVWLEPLPGTKAPPFVPHERYTLVQKNRVFIPHLQVIPAGSTVQFPNEDPFFHNVFSLYNGRRFDLGLYEAGASKAVTFSRPGISYIFCNIHPEMSAVIVSLDTPIFAVADTRDAFLLKNVPSGDYEMNLWVEGVPQATLSQLKRRLHVASGTTDLGAIRIPLGNAIPSHTNEFGHSYDRTSKSPY
jgi:plastocyanin